MRSQPNELPFEIAAQLADAAGAFQKRFGRPPTLAACAPGRVNLIGEHTDYNHGFVLPMAIQRQTIVVADLVSGDQSTLCTAEGECLTLDLNGPLKPRPESMLNLPLGVVAQVAKTAGPARLPSLDVLDTSTIPRSAGLSSSAAIEVAYATLLDHMMKLGLKPLEKAMLCQQAEHEYGGVPCGIMDMYVSAAAQASHALLIDCRSNQFQAVPMPPRDQAVALVVNTRTKHSLEGDYVARRATCERAATALGVPALRDAGIDMLDNPSLTSDERAKALHVISENSRTVLAAEALASGDLQTLGNLMFESHDSLRDLYDVSCDELNVLVNAARTMKGHEVFGARMTGAGFGGCMIVLCRSDSVDEVMRRLNESFRAAFDRECEMFTTGAAGGAQVLHLGAKRQVGAVR